MRNMVKIIMAFINLTCILLSLLLPNSATPVSLIPAVISTASWVFIQDFYEKSMPKTHIVLVMFAAVIVAALFILGNITELQEINGYVIRFREEIALVGGCEISYNKFAITSFVVIAILAIAEVIGSWTSNKATIDGFEDIIDRVIEK